NQAKPITMSSPSSKKITLESSDGVTFEVEEAVALQSPAIEKIMKEGPADNGGVIKVPSRHLKGDILAKVIEYLKKHLEEEDMDAIDAASKECSREKHLEEEDKEGITYYDAASQECSREFVNVDQNTLSDFILVEEDMDASKEWRREFVKVDQNTLFDLILAANDLQIKSLLDLTCGNKAKPITLKSSDDVTFEVEEAVALQSPVIKKIIEEGLADNEGAIKVVSQKGIKGDILAKVIEYLKTYTASRKKIWMPSPIMAPSRGGEKITLESADGVTFEVEEAVALQSPVIEKIMKEGPADNGGVIKVPGEKRIITGDILAKVIEYLKKNLEQEDMDASKDWRGEFVKVDQNTLFDLILAANDLQIKSLLDLTCQVIANMIKGKSVEQIMDLFNINNDFTPRGQ
ncbi:hypothetical protein Tsubulata_001609, partial [Turnera subulata]